MKNITEIKKYIQAEYGISPNVYKDGVLQYRAISFELAKDSIILANKLSDRFWKVQRNGHSVDFFRGAELKDAIGPGGSLLYYIMPEDRI
jgi:hypothetical protein